MVVAAGSLWASGCTPGSAGPESSARGAVDSPGAGAAAARAAREQGAVAIDVRSPQEHAAGHVDGAQLIDVQSPAFDAQIAALDGSTTYVVYCRSGNRSARAAERMREAGLTVLDGGSLDDMASTGWAVTS